MSVRRYDVENGDMYPNSESGNMVEYEDYARLTAELAEANYRLDRFAESEKSLAEELIDSTKCVCSEHQTQMVEAVKCPWCMLVDYQVNLAEKRDAIVRLAEENKELDGKAYTNGELYNKEYLKREAAERERDELKKRLKGETTINRIGTAMSSIERTEFERTIKHLESRLARYESGVEVEGIPMWHHGLIYLPRLAEHLKLSYEMGQTVRVVVNK